MDDLCDRRGICNEWELFDDKVKKDIYPNLQPD